MPPHPGNQNGEGGENYGLLKQQLATLVGAWSSDSGMLLAAGEL